MNTSLFSWFYYEILENKLSTFFIPHHNDDLVVVDKLTWEPTDEFDKGCGLCMAYGNEDFANWCNGFFSDIKAEGLWDQMQSDAAAELDAKALEDFIAQ